MSKEFERDVLEKLDVVTKLLSQYLLSEDASQTQSIERLKRVGLRPKQISEVLGTTQNYVNMVLSTKKRLKKKNG